MYFYVCFCDMLTSLRRDPARASYVDMRVITAMKQKLPVALPTCVLKTFVSCENILSSNDTFSMQQQDICLHLSVTSLYLVVSCLHMTQVETIFQRLHSRATPSGEIHRWQCCDALQCAVLSRGHTWNGGAICATGGHDSCERDV